MPDNLQTIVGRMSAAGESEEAIASVIQYYKRPTKDDYKGPDSFWEGVGQSVNPMNGGGEAYSAAGQGALGYAKGAIGDLPSTIGGALGDLGHSIMHPVDTIKGAYDLATHPGETMHGVVDPMIETAQKAGSDPFAFGEMMGQTTGQPLATEGLIKGAPSFGPSMIRGAGRGLEATGDMIAQHRPLTGMLPRFADSRTMRAVEGAAGRGLSRVGRGIQDVARPTLEGEIVPPNPPGFTEGEIIPEQPPAQLAGGDSPYYTQPPPSPPPEGPPYGGYGPVSSEPLRGIPENAGPSSRFSEGDFGPVSSTEPVPDIFTQSTQKALPPRSIFEAPGETPIQLPPSSVFTPDPTIEPPAQIIGHGRTSVTINDVLNEEQPYVRGQGPGNLKPRLPSEGEIEGQNKLGAHFDDVYGPDQSLPGNGQNLTDAQARELSQSLGRPNSQLQQFNESIGGGPTSELPDLHHGTTRDFETFDSSKSPGSGFGNYKNWTSFTENPEYAELYSKGKFGTMQREMPKDAGIPRVIKANVKAGNVLDLTKPLTDTDRANIATAYSKVYKGKVPSLADDTFAKSLVPQLYEHLPYDAIKHSEHGQSNWAVNPAKSKINITDSGRSSTSPMDELQKFNETVKNSQMPRNAPKVEANVPGKKVDAAHYPTMIKYAKSKGFEFVGQDADGNFKFRKK